MNFVDQSKPALAENAAAAQVFEAFAKAWTTARACRAVVEQTALDPGPVLAALGADEFVKLAQQLAALVMFGIIAEERAELRRQADALLNRAA